MRPVLELEELVERVVELHDGVAAEQRSRRRASWRAARTAGTARTAARTALQRPAAPRAPFQLAVALFIAARQARAVLDS